MLFRKPTLKDRERLKPFYDSCTFRTCDYTLGCLLMWEETYFIEICEEEDVLYLRQNWPDGRTNYRLPLGNTEKGLRKLLEEQGTQTLTLQLVPEAALPLFQGMQQLQVTEDRDIFDYLYLAEDLKNLTGKKYAGQRNHIHKFEKATETWALEDLTEQNLPEVLEFFDSVYDMGADASEAAVHENKIVRTIVQSPEAYQMFGSALRANGKIVGFSLAEKRGDTLYTHIEKADRNYPGAYQMLVNSFVKKHADEGILYVNREDDTGDPGLRTAKLAYHPFSLLKKHNVTVSVRKSSAE